MRSCLTKLLPMIAGVIALACQACGTHATGLWTKRDIAMASADTKRVAIPFLPIEDYGRLAKFKDLEQVSYFSVDGSGGTNAKLEALAKLNPPKLADLDLLNSPQVTDRGIRHLAKIGSLRMMQLEGTSITDAATATMVREMKLTGVNVANCPKVSYEGIQRLARSKTLEELGFSADRVTQAQVLSMIDHLGSAKYLSIVDPKKKLDEKLLEEAGIKKGIQVVILDKGAMQYIPR